MSIRRISNGVFLPSSSPSLPIKSSLLKVRYSPIMSTLILNADSSSTSMSSIDSSAKVTGVQNGQLPDVTPFITPYLLKTLEMLHKTHGSSPHIQLLSRNLSYQYHVTGIPRPTTHLEIYSMRFFTERNGLPHHLPFIGDDCAQIIPFTASKPNHGVMEDIIEAIRRTTTLHLNNETPVFYPPTTGDIQSYLATRWPQKYPATYGVASGWRNTVNQCLTHGQGWNFLTFPPIDGTKNKRHLLFERAFNASYIVGSGQCKSLNDLKPKSEATIQRTRRPMPTPPPTSDDTDPEMTTSPWATPTPEPMVGGESTLTRLPGTQWPLDTTFEQLWEQARPTSDPCGLLDKAEKRLMACMPEGDAAVESSRTLDEIEMELMGLIRYENCCC